METKTLVIIIVVVVLALGGAGLAWWWMKGRKPVTGTPQTTNGKLMADVINNLDWNSRTCSMGRQVMQRVVAQARALTPKPVAGKPVPAILCSDALGKINIKKVLEGVPNINAVTMKAASKAMDTLLTDVIVRECRDGAITGDVLADALEKMTEETCNPSTGSLLGLYKSPAPAAK